VDRHHPERQAVALARALGWVTAGLGAVILAGWIFQVPILKSLFPGQVEAKANTAICFILAGVALALKAGSGGQSRPRVMAANLLAALVVCTGLLTLGEYFLGRNLGVDELIFRDMIDAVDTVHPGRLALPTALNFLLLGTAVILIRSGRGRPVVAWLAVPAVALAGLAFIGQLYNLPYLATFGPFTPIAAPTGVIFLILSAGALLAGASRLAARLRDSGLLIGFAAAVLLLFFLAGAVVHNTRSLIRNTSQVTDSQDVLGRLAGLLSAVQDVETGARGYLLTGDPGFLEYYMPAPTTADRHLQELRRLTAGNPRQQELLDRLAPLIATKINWVRQQVELQRKHDSTAMPVSASTLEGRRLMDAIRVVVGAMQQEENRMLEERQARLDAGTQRTLQTLGLGLIVAVGLLLTVFALLRHEIARSTRSEAALHESDVRYRTLFNSIDEGFCIIEMIFDPQGKPADYWFLEINQSFERQTGLRDVEGKRIRELVPQLEAHWFETYGRVARTGEAERFQNRAEQLHRTFDVYAFRLGDPKNRQVAVLFQDITEHQRNEAEIRRLNADLLRRAAQLESANHELEAFSYSVSHDLRAPLRHVQGYVEMLTREAQASLTDKARHYLKTITEAAREMGELIDDLLAFSRMGRTEMQEATLNLAPLVEETRAGLMAAGDGRKIRWKIGALPLVRGDAAMLRQVLVNLLDNAVKYTRRRESAEIEIGCAGQEEGRNILFVRDNGAGFDLKYADKLFGVFQRLHRADEFEGTGIGLASVRRIISRHGGRTWAEGRVDAGATFYFTLAPAPVDQPSSPPART
jgi:signal transduction histidine kinase/CHASE3 domain sensor protein